MKNRLLPLFAALLSCLNATAQAGNNSPLTIKEIMKGEAFVGHLPSDAHWSADGTTLYFSWNPVGAPADSLYAYSLKNKTTAKISFAAGEALPAPTVSFNSKKTKGVYAKNGDVFVMDAATSRVTPVTLTEEREHSPHFTNHGSRVAYVKNEDVYAWDLATGTTEQLTRFVEKKEEEAKRDDKDEWLYRDQLALFEVLRERREKQDAGDKIRKSLDAAGPPRLETGKKSVQDQQMDPSGRYLTYLLTDRPRTKGTLVPHYVTESGYTEDQNTRSKVGDPPATFEMFVYDYSRRKGYPVNFDSLEGLDYIPEFTKDYPDKTYENKNRLGRIGEPVWNQSGSKALLDIQANDFKDRWIVLLDAETGTVEQIDRQHDQAWIAGPGIGGFGRAALGWLPDDNGIWFVSETTGYAHLYSHDLQSRTTRALTSGEFEIYEPQLSEDKTRWYFSANSTHPGDRQFYSMPVNGGKLEQLTHMTGLNEVVLSPDEKQMAILHSYSNRPTELYLQPNPLKAKKGSEPARLTHSTTPEFENYPWKDPEIITFHASDGARVYARLYRPLAAADKHAAVLFVHGAGYLQNAHKWWSSYFREYMFHNLLVDNGYTVLDIDYRGSAGYGRDWRTGIYRHMGGKDLSDQADGARFLTGAYGIDPGRIGIYGGSYGGFITLMALFKNPETFQAGAAIRSVGDWAAYNHGYTARILNTPAADSLAYRRSSPIYFADGLKGRLLILHGMVDDNVHFQDMVRLSQRLIELGKENWEMAVYPVERHGFVEPSSWTDEYTRIFNLFREVLLKE